MLAGDADNGIELTRREGPETPAVPCRAGSGN